VKKTRAFLPTTEQAAAALGSQIAAARKELGWTQAQLAGRLGTTRHLVSKVESGSTSPSLGMVLEAAILCGVPLFGLERDELHSFARSQQDRAALLPTRVRHRPVEIPNDF
jgi:transcriptional regulator with XRE-family HTH domain